MCHTICSNATLRVHESWLRSMSMCKVLVPRLDAWCDQNPDACWVVLGPLLCAA
jgi:hypothetical protein